MLRRSSSLSSSSLLRVASYSHAAFLDVLQSQLGEAKSAGTLKLERTITSPQERLIAVQGGTEKVINFCANNYLGLSNHPALVKGAQEALKTHGFGLSSVRFICGTQDIHKELEKELARFHGTEDAILYGSCFDANGGVFEALLGPEDAIISDELNHASIIDGIRLCKAQRFRYSHRNMAELEKALQDSASCRTRYIVTDGVFSMDGTIAPLDEMARLADRYNALLMTDECHSTGFMGDSGKGIPELLNAKVDVISSTLGKVTKEFAPLCFFFLTFSFVKALGGATGGYIAGPSPVVGILRQRSRPYLFSNSVAPCVVGASLEALKLVQSHEGAKLRQKLKENVAAFRSKVSFSFSLPLVFFFLTFLSCPSV